VTQDRTRWYASAVAPVAAYVPGTDAVYTRQQYAAEIPSCRPGRPAFRHERNGLGAGARRGEGVR
jgi:hypothetical protein